MTKTVRLIVIEDHEATAKGLKAELSAEPDIEVVAVAATSQAGLQSVQELKPDIVLLDLHLPDSSGPKALTEAFCSLDGVKVIVFSGDSRIAILQIVLQSGAAGYLLKSEPIENVVSAIREVAAGRSPVLSAELSDKDHPKVTNAEQHLLRMLARGMKYNDIAAIRVTSPETVRKQVDILVDKLKVESREALIVWAVENGYSKLELHQ